MTKDELEVLYDAALRELDHVSVALHPVAPVGETLLERARDVTERIQHAEARAELLSRRIREVSGGRVDAATETLARCEEAMSSLTYDIIGGGATDTKVANLVDAFRRQRETVWKHISENSKLEKLAVSLEREHGDLHKQVRRLQNQVHRLEAAAAKKEDAANA